MNVPELRAKYEEKAALYEQMLTAPDAAMKLEQIKALNQELTAIVDELMQKLTSTQTTEGVSISVAQQELLTKLRQLQRDYQQLSDERDTAETLRRIRVDEESRMNKSLYVYILIFLGVSILILAAIFIANKFAQTSEIITPIPSSPSAMPALT